MLIFHYYSDTIKIRKEFTTKHTNQTKNYNMSVFPDFFI
jgi:hypothetical protein